MEIRELYRDQDVIIVNAGSDKEAELLALGWTATPGHESVAENGTGRGRGRKAAADQIMEAPQE